MSTPAPTLISARRALVVGIAGMAATAVGLLVSGAHIVATAWLVADR